MGIFCKSHCERLALACGLALLSPAVLAMSPEDALANVTRILIYGTVMFVIVAVAGVYFMKSQDRRQTPLGQILAQGAAVYAAAPDATVSECVQQMVAERIGALVILEDGKLRGIFTERDALNKVLAMQLDPRSTRVSEVMTRDPCCLSLAATVGEAMELVTRRRFRHLPIMKDGRLLAIVSSGDLTRWLVREQLPELQGLVNLATLP
jgi:CBS domain-containing protein